MRDALVIGVVVAIALACPVMMWLGRRGVGPGCAMPGCTPRRRDEETLEDLRRRQRQLEEQIARLEAEDERSSQEAREPARSA